MRREIFDTHTVRDLGHALGGSNGNVQENSVNFFIDAIAHGISLHFQGRIMLIFTEDFCDKPFDAQITAAFKRALNDGDPKVRGSIIKFFTAAMAQGEFLCIDWILTLKDSQRGFGTRHLRQRSSLHLDMH